MSELQLIREAIFKALPGEHADSLEEIKPQFVYIPAGHAKALRLESTLIVGGRGVGKTFWTKALSSKTLRTLLAQPVPELEKTNIYIGNSSEANPDSYPDKDTLTTLLDSFDAYDIWRTVMIRHLDSVAEARRTPEGFSASVAWIREHPEEVAKIAKNVETLLKEEGRYILLLFDALDRTSDDWKRMDEIVLGLLKATQWLKTYFRMNAKIFLRKDQYDRLQGNFPDASKLLATRVELQWSANDLHGLLWQQLCNAPEKYGEALREFYRDVVGSTPRKQENIYTIEDRVKRETNIQRALFERLAGQWMGNGPKKGVPYTWLVNHLGDAYQQASPRSFVAAIRTAADDSQNLTTDYKYALHFESIKKGVQQASETRVNEVAEDFPWVRKVMQPLEGLTVPNDYVRIEERWKSEFPDPIQISTNLLPPPHLEKGWSGIRDDLERLGIFEIMNNGRINLPDIYRVGFKLGRKGGVKPIK